MRNRVLPFVLLSVIALLNVPTWAQRRLSATKPASAKTSTKAASKSVAKGKSAKSKKAVAKAKKKKPVSRARLRRVAQAFVTSADLKPMAQQLIANRTAAAYSGVESYARKHAGTDAGAMAWLAVGYAHVLDKEYAKALPALDKSQVHAGELGDYVRYFKALAYGGNGDSANVLASLKDFTKNWNDSIFARDVVDIYGNALAAEGRTKEAIDFLEEDREPVRADIEIALGRAYVRSGNLQKGTEILQHLYFTMPVSTEAAAAGADLDKLAESTPPPPVPYAVRRVRADLLAKANRWSDASREYRALLNDAPEGERTDVTVLLGVALRRSGNLAEGRRLLEQTEAAGEANAQRLYNLGEIARSEEDEVRVMANLSRLRESSATSAWFQNALMSAGNMYLLKRDYDKAIDQFREIDVRFSGDPRASYAHWKAAWLSYRQGRREEAKKEFTRQVEVYPNSTEVPAALYWRARIAEEDGDLVTARAWYAKCADRFRNYYYGIQARTRLANLKGDAAPVADAVLDRIPPIRPYENEELAEDPPSDDLRVQKSKLLENAGLSDFAIKELQAASGGKGPNWATLQIARIYKEQGQHHRALQFLKRALPSYYSLDISALPRAYWEYLFPKPYWTELRRYSLANGLDPYMVASLIRQESEFNPGALSHANAWGLMQLLPTVGRGMAREVKLKRFSTEQLLVPNTNMQLGTRYFKQMIDQHGGQVEYALAAYNAGANRVEDWLANGKYSDVVEFVESIPFTETREYVQAIVRNAQVYRKLYPE